MAHDLPDRPVTCIACGDRRPRADAREYDKHGDRWDREGKSFEYVCKPCFRELNKGRRDDLETTLERVGAGRVPLGTFLRRFAAESDAEDGCEPRRYD